MPMDRLEICGFVKSMWIKNGYHPHNRQSNNNQQELQFLPKQKNKQHLRPMSTYWEDFLRQLQHKVLHLGMLSINHHHLHLDFKRILGINRHHSMPTFTRNSQLLLQPWVKVNNLLSMLILPTLLLLRQIRSSSNNPINSMLILEI